MRVACAFNISHDIQSFVCEKAKCKCNFVLEDCSCLKIVWGLCWCNLILGLPQIRMPLLILFWVLSSLGLSLQVKEWKVHIPVFEPRPCKMIGVMKQKRSRFAGKRCFHSSFHQETYFCSYLRAGCSATKGLIPNCPESSENQRVQFLVKPTKQFLSTRSAGCCLSMQKREASVGNATEGTQLQALLSFGQVFFPNS